MSQRSTVQAGQDVDSFCGKCGLELAHIVIAKTPGRAAKVQCKTCGAQHAMRASKKAASASKTLRAAAGSRTRARTSPSRAEQSFAEALAGRDRAQATAWSLQQRFAKGDMLTHAHFGFGLVESVTAPNKITVWFESHGTKVLLHSST